MFVTGSSRVKSRFIRKVEQTWNKNFFNFPSASAFGSLWACCLHLKPTCPEKVQFPPAGPDSTPPPRPPVPSRSVYLQRWHGWCHVKLLLSWHVLCTPYNHAPCHFMWNHIHKVHARLAATCHLHFWQNDQDILHATAGTQGCCKESQMPYKALQELHCELPPCTTHYICPLHYPCFLL